MKRQSFRNEDQASGERKAGSSTCSVGTSEYNTGKHDPGGEALT